MARNPRPDKDRLDLLEYRVTVLESGSATSGSGGTPDAHAASHKNGGSDEVATATPGANEIPKANASGQLVAGWGGAASTLATLNASTKVVEDPANATATPTASKIPIADGSGKLAAGWGGSASTLATLNASTKVVEDPANATATPGASKIPIADGSGKLAAGWGGAASTLATLNASSKVVEDPANATATPTASKLVIADANALIDGWVSDATTGTKGKVQLADCLAGTATAPKVVGVKESGGTTLAMGSVSDGQLLKRSGSSVIGVSATGVFDEADLRLGKTFFSTNSLLPATTYQEQLYTMPAPDFSNLNSGTLTRTMGQIEYLTSGTNVHNFGWDTGAARTKLLFIMSSVKTRNNGLQMFFCDSAPGVGEPPNTLYMFNLDINGSQLQIQKRAGGAYTTLVTYNKFLINDAYASAGVDMAFYYDDSANSLRGFLRYGLAMWFQVITVTDSSFTTMRYAGFRIASTGGLTSWMGCPMALYYTT